MQHETANKGIDAVIEAVKSARDETRKLALFGGVLTAFSFLSFYARGKNSGYQMDAMLHAMLGACMGIVCTSAFTFFTINKVYASLVQANGLTGTNAPTTPNHIELKPLQITSTRI